MTQVGKNKSRIEARVLSLDDQDGGWGNFAQIKVESVAAVDGFGHFCAGLAGTQVTVFVPPPFANKLKIGLGLKGFIISTGVGYRLADVELVS
ncbi:hypothetical protein KKF05_03190 [Patescibacteria group bacterium]|nr:hypothetical protein [Patescibacteria group bacterium]MBU1028860.1 hypothetical protein [Patescibacteria group bacterium]MBU1915765.1 hypothetical protein [Patescibacteria group bacterium]